MSESRADHVKILFDIESDEGIDEIETLWAVREKNGYRLDGIPFYVRKFAHGDVVSATPDAGGSLRCTGLVAPSRHSTIRLWFADAKDVQAVRVELRAKNCESQLDLARLVAVDVPPDVAYAEICEYLDQKRRQGILEYEEGCIGQQES